MAMKKPHSPVPAWKAYRDLFAFVENKSNWNLIKPRFSALVEALNKDATVSNFPKCKYGVRAIQYWQTNPASGKRSSRPRDYRVEHLHDWLTRQLSDPEKTTYSEALATLAPEALESKKARDEAYHAPVQSDWDRPGIKELVAKFDLFPSIDSVILLYRPPERTDGTAAWLEGDIDLKISKQLVNVAEFKHLRPICTAWERTHRQEARGVRYCVEEVKSRTGDSGGRLTLKVRPIGRVL
jgi:hypothetical protein